MRSRSLETTVLAAGAGAMWTQLPQVSLRLRRLSLKCWFMGHDAGYAALLIACISSASSAAGKHTVGQPKITQSTEPAAPSRARRCSNIKAILRSRWFGRQRARRRDLTVQSLTMAAT